MIEKTAAITNIGCKVSKYEADAMAESLSSAGYKIVGFNERASIYIINTCTVTNIGDKKSRQLIRRAKQFNKNAVVVAAGCYSQVSPQEVCKIDGVDIVIGTKGHSDIVAIINNYLLNDCKKTSLVSDISAAYAYEKSYVSGRRDRVRAYVKIEDGCNNFCSYCIIPYARGRVRSRHINEVMDEVTSLCLNGVNEIVLTGIHVASYGKDLVDTTLLSLIETVHETKELKRLRLSSLEPNIIKEEFIKSVAELNKFCGHFHLSLQSGCDKTLLAMNRKYTASQYKNSVSLIKEYFPKSAVWTDVIAGFPGETDLDFEESYEFIKNSGVVKLHIFPFSPKKGTKAWDMDAKVSDGLKAARALRLKELDKMLYTDFLNKNIGENIKVLFEKKGSDGYYYGHTDNYILVKAQSEIDISNEILMVRLVSVCEKGIVLGEISHIEKGEIYG